MKLHLDKDAFAFIIDEVAQEKNIRRDVLEKDYYVTLILKELSEKENQGYAYFKGGTALYKALKSIRRFSEDIDLTVYVEDCPTQSQAKKRLENATQKYKQLQKGETIENIRGSITCEYLYDSLYTLDDMDVLQRFGRVKIEATSFTVSEPTTKIEIAPHLYELCGEDRRKILREQYDVAPFDVETISLERIFIDKVFATQFYYERKMYADVSKHIYDLTVLLENKQIQSFLSDKERVLRIIGLKRKEELERKGGVDANQKIVEFDYFYRLKTNKDFEKSFSEMQKIYVFDKTELLPFELVLSAVDKLQQVLNLE